MDINSYKLNFIEDAKENIKDFDEQLVTEAWDFAIKAHGKQKRDSGNFYYEHPVSVARTLLNMNCDSDTIAAALLHDVVEDTSFCIDDIRENFGDDVGFLVQGVTKIPNLDKLFSQQKARDSAKKKARDLTKTESLKKLFNAIIDDYRVAIIKLADRLHNLKTLGAILEPDRRKKIASESLLIYAPLAEVLGYEIQQKEIQKIAFSYYNPKIYNELKKKIDSKSHRYNSIKDKVVDVIENKLEEKNIKADVYGRRKEIYSIYKKMETEQLEFDEVYDIIGIRIILDTKEECYSTLLVIEELGKEIKFEDYIENPRPPFNYESLHKVIANREWGKVEIQIRTYDMHESAEKGAASHWKYKYRGSIPKDIEDRLSFLRDTINSIDENDSLKDVQEKLNQSLKPFITVYTRDHDAIFLPIGSTALDFAYNIHTEIGHTCFAAKVNNKFKRKDIELSDLDKVEIITKKGEEPKPDWIYEGKVKTGKAKQKIENYLRKQKNIELKTFGEKLVNKHIRICADYKINDEKIFGKLYQIFSIKNKDDLFIMVAINQKNLEKFRKYLGDIILKKVIEEISFPKEIVTEIPSYFFKEKMISDSLKESLYDKIGRGGILSNEIKKTLNKLKDKILKHPEKLLKSGTTNIGIDDDLLYNIPKCCYPVPGDKITGFVTLGKGISIHRANCPHIIQIENKIKKDARLIKLNWNDLSINKGNKFIVELLIALINDHPSTYKELNEMITLKKGIIQKLIPLGIPKRKSYQVPFVLFIYVDNIDHLEKVMNGLKHINGVASVKRNYQ